MQPDERGDLPCTQLGLRLGRRPTLYRGAWDLDYLRWIDTDGTTLSTGEELAREAEQHRREAEQLAHEATQRADKAEAELEGLRRKLATQEQKGRKENP